MDGCWGGGTGKAVCLMVSCCRCIWRVVKESRGTQAEQHTKLKVTKEMLDKMCRFWECEGSECADKTEVVGGTAE